MSVKENIIKENTDLLVNLEHMLQSVHLDGGGPGRVMQ